MISTKGVILAEEAEKLMDTLDDEAAWRFYVSDFKINKRMHSPLRRDSDPSFCIFLGRAGKLLYIDYSTGESGDLVKFVMKLKGMSYYQAIKQIALDMNLKSVGSHTTSIARDIRVSRREIKVIPRKFGEHDLIYWEQYGIRLPNLVKFDVYALESVFLDDVLISEYKKSQPVYGYYLGNGWKIYKPYSTQRFYCNTNTLQGYRQLPASGDMLIITKSMKDVMLLDTLGYPAVAPHGERVKIIDEIAELKERFKTIVIFFDNDEPGIEGAKILSEKYQLPMIYIDPAEKVKDLSDYYRVNNYAKTEQTLEYLLCQKTESLKLA